jgi:fatty-acyl-CoA synthase
MPARGRVLSGGRNLQFHDSWLRRESKTPLKWQPAGSNAARSPLIFFTSGTTGMPKKMIVPGDAILEWVPALPIIGNASAERLLVIPNLSSGFGYNHTALLFFAGKTACFARGPEAQLALINAFKVDQFLASPQQALELVQAIEKGATYQLDSLEIARIGGSVMSKDFVQRVQTCLCRSIVSQYGATETGVIAFASWDVISDTPNAVGFVVPTVPVEIVDDDDKLLPRGEVGRVRFRSGYFAKIQAANNPDRAAASSDPWWYPGDLGLLTNGGVLSIEAGG